MSLQVSPFGAQNPLTNDPGKPVSEAIRGWTLRRYYEDIRIHVCICEHCALDPGLRISNTRSFKE